MKTFFFVQFIRCLIIWFKLFKRHDPYFDDIREIDQIRFGLPKHSIKITDFLEEDEDSEEFIKEVQQWCIENFGHRAKIGGYIIKKFDNPDWSWFDNNDMGGYLRFKNEEEVTIFSLKWL